MYTEICKRCKRTAPTYCIAPFMSSESKPQTLCAVCALEVRNEDLGLPADTPFQGEIASEMWEVAMDHYKRTKQI